MRVIDNDCLCTENVRVTRVVREPWKVVASTGFEYHFFHAQYVKDNKIYNETFFHQIGDYLEVIGEVSIKEFSDMPLLIPRATFQKGQLEMCFMPTICRAVVAIRNMDTPKPVLSGSLRSYFLSQDLSVPCITIIGMDLSQPDGNYYSIDVRYLYMGKRKVCNLIVQPFDSGSIWQIFGRHGVFLHDFYMDRPFVKVEKLLESAFETSIPFLSKIVRDLLLEILPWLTRL